MGLYEKDIIDMLADKKSFEDYIHNKKERSNISENELAKWKAYIDSERYQDVVRSIRDGDYVIPIPVRRSINKVSTGKKRTIYSFGEEYNRILKIIAFLLHRYDSVFADNCIAFRHGKRAGDVLRELAGDRCIMGKYCLKLDISDYFNSIDTDILMEKMSFLKEKDDRLYCFFDKLLHADMAYDNAFTGEAVHIKRGAMAGIPVAPFFANVYLMDMDWYFEREKIQYFRYSDDIIVFANEQDKIDEYKKIIISYFDKLKIKVNESKTKIFMPGEGFEFLGFKMDSSGIDLSDTTKVKIKGKIRRKAGALRRWCDKKNLSYEKGAKGFVKAMNYKFFAGTKVTEFSWSRWFFPVITTDAGLGEIDKYMQEYIRYCITGRHNKCNYKVTYDDLKNLGYRNLVHEWYKSKNIK